MAKLLRVAGEVFITIGAIALLFLVYQLWWTSVVADRQAARNAESIVQDWQSGVTSEEPPSEDIPPPAEGTGFALLTVPRLGANMDQKPVLQGVSLDVLAQGMGHYPESAMPGQAGNFAVAGHRITYGEPLRHVDTLQVGDNVYVETKDFWYTYRLAKSEIVLPDATWTITPQPFGSETDLGDRLITLTTCEPLYGNSHRWIWWGELVETTPKTEGAPTMSVSS